MASPREYREHLYRLRTHPEEGDEPILVDRRDSFLTVYFTMLPFLGVEYLLHRSFHVVPPGLIFPVGYLLFWAFYYTYYKPGFLEERLTAPSSWNIANVTTVLVGVAIWFVKVTIVELSQVLFLRWLFPRPRMPVARQLDQFRRVPTGIPMNPSYREFSYTARPRSTSGTYAGPRPTSTDGTYAGPRPTSTGGTYADPRPGSTGGTYAGPRPGSTGGTYAGPRPTATPPSPPPSGLPMDIKAALLILGLPEKVSWDQVHRRYRELAKKYHPDLNQESTDIGRHFMRVDAAYRRLSAVRDKYFAAEKSVEKQRAGG